MPSITPSVTVLLDKERHVRLDRRAIFQSEIELSRLWQQKISFLKLMAYPEDLGLNDLSVLLWQGLLHDDPTLTLAQVQDTLMTFDKIEVVVDVIIRAWNAATADIPPATTHGAAQSGEAGGDSDPLSSPGEIAGATTASPSE